MTYPLYHKFGYFFHPLGWLILYLLPYLFSFEGLPTIFTLFSNPGDYLHLVSFIFLITFAYVNHFRFVPFYYFKSKYFLYALLLGISFWIVVDLPVFLLPASAFGNMGGPPKESKPLPLLFGRNYTVLLFTASVFTSISIQIRARLQKIEQEKLKATLSTLKAQINPHFLFNTLNSIYALVINKDDKAADAIVHLSELMRYSLHETEGDFVSLHAEVEYIRHYIALQKARLGNTVDVCCKIIEDCNDRKIAPLLLITFIENAFKHGVNPNEQSKIDIFLKVDADAVRLVVTNKKVTSVAREGGIGLKNIHERLKLLYPSNHILKISNNSDTFFVDVVIQC